MICQIKLHTSPASALALAPQYKPELNWHCSGLVTGTAQPLADWAMIVQCDGCILTPCTCSGTKYAAQLLKLYARADCCLPVLQAGMSSLLQM